MFTSFALAKNKQEATSEWLHKTRRESITFIQDLINTGKREGWDFVVWFDLWCFVFFPSLSYFQNQLQEIAYTHCT